jgi:hypothetical protein
LTVRSLLVAAVAFAAAATAFPLHAEAQRRVAVPRRPGVVRPSVVVRPVVVRARPTVFVGGFYYPTLYRASLSYGYGGYYRYGGYYGPYFGAWPYYQWPPYYGYSRYDLSGSVRTQVEPRQTEVFIDGYYAGTVDDYDGVFQRLHIEPGDHEIALYLPGHRPHQQRVYVQPGRTFTIRHTMEPLAPGEAEPVRPAGAPLPPPGAPYPGPDPRDPNATPPERIGDPRRPEPQVRTGSPAAQGFGQLSLRVQPADAEVFIDGEKWEGALQSERLEVQLGTGVHRLEIRRDGYRTYFTDITIANGQTRTVNVALTRN